MPKYDELGTRPTADIVEFFDRCSRGEALALKLKDEHQATRLRFRLNQVRKRMRDEGKYTHWSIVQLAIRPTLDAEGKTIGYRLVGQLRDEEYDDAFAEALGRETDTASPHDAEEGSITNILRETNKADK